MEANMRPIQRVYTALCVSFIFVSTVACAPTSYRAHPELDTRVRSIKTIGILPADIRIYELSAGDVEELQDDWSDQGRENVMRAALAGLKNHNVQAKSLTIRKEFENEMEDIQTLYWAVSASILYYAYGEQGIPEKRKNFVYSVGSMKKFLDTQGVDAVLLVSGYDEVSTGGRKALRALSMFTSIITGVTKRSGMTGISAALVDKSGSVLWYNISVQEGGYDLRDAGSAKGMVNLVLRDFPETIR
jgi:hypothetical protein